MICDILHVTKRFWSLTVREVLLVTVNVHVLNHHHKIRAGWKVMFQLNNSFYTAQSYFTHLVSSHLCLICVNLDRATYLNQSDDDGEQDNLWLRLRLLHGTKPRTEMWTKWLQVWINQLSLSRGVKDGPDAGPVGFRTGFVQGKGWVWVYYKIKSC